MGRADDLPARLRETRSPTTLEGVSVLVVDDNASNRRILQAMLERWEMKITLVEDAEKAMTQLLRAQEADSPFDLILTDMHMPGVDGFGLIERIRQKPELSTASVMMLTSAGHRGDAARCEELGVAAYLLKPIRQSELYAAISRALGTKGEAIRASQVTADPLRATDESALQLKLLVAEDNTVNQLLLTRLLEKRGHHVALVGNGRKALEALEKESYDLVLMDIQMPEMDGLEATEALRRSEQHTSKRQPVVALTAHAMKGDEERCLAAGMDGYLTKPIRPSELDAVLQIYVERRRLALAKESNQGRFECLIDAQTDK
jgi:two-component system sensor histidine kinase/response regulator